MVPCSHRDESEVLGVIQTTSFVLTAQAGPHFLPATGVRHLQSNLLGIRPLLGLMLQLHETRNQRGAACASSGSTFPASSFPAGPLLCPATGTCPCITTCSYNISSCCRCILPCFPKAWHLLKVSLW